MNSNQLTKLITSRLKFLSTEFHKLSGKQCADLINFEIESLNKVIPDAICEINKRPLKDWPSELLYDLFWCNDVNLDAADKSGRIAEMIHAEMNARGEGEKVAV